MASFTTPNQAMFGSGSTTASNSTPAFQFANTAAPTSILGALNSTIKTNNFGTSNQSVTTVGLNFPTSTSTNTAGIGQTFNTSVMPTVNSGITAPSFAFGTSTTPTSKNTLGSSSLNTTTPNFNLGTSTNNTILGSSAATTTLGTINFGIDKITSVTTSSHNPETSTAATKGLGGLTSQTKTGSIVTTHKEISPKEQSLPNEILQTVDQFRDVVKQQKLYSSDIARCSVRDFRNVEQDIDLFNNLLSDVENHLEKNKHLAEKLKYDTAKCLQNIEIAQGTQDTPPGLQYDNNAPLKYFLDLANIFDKEMQSLKNKIESADKYVKNHQNPDTLTPQDLSLGMKQLHETFVALAGRLQSVHTQVESQKESFLNIRRQLYNDNSNPFNGLNKPEIVLGTNIKNAITYFPPKVATGPTPFNNLITNDCLTSQQTSFSIPHSGTALNNTSAGMPFSSYSSNVPNFGVTQSPFGVSSTNFQLQKPPTGNKRGKQ